MLWWYFKIMILIESFSYRTIMAAVKYIISLQKVLKH